MYNMYIELEYNIVFRLATDDDTTRRETRKDRIRDICRIL